MRALGWKELGVFEKLICGPCGRSTEADHQDGREERRERGKQAQCGRGTVLGGLCLRGALYMRVQKQWWNRNDCTAV